MRDLKLSVVSRTEVWPSELQMKLQTAAYWPSPQQKDLEIKLLRGRQTVLKNKLQSATQKILELTLFHQSCITSTGRWHQPSCFNLQWRWHGLSWHDFTTTGNKQTVKVLTLEAEVSHWRCFAQPFIANSYDHHEFYKLHQVPSRNLNRSKTNTLMTINLKWQYCRMFTNKKWKK